MNNMTYHLAIWMVSLFICSGQLSPEISSPDEHQLLYTRSTPSFQSFSRDSTKDVSHILPEIAQPNQRNLDSSSECLHFLCGIRNEPFNPSLENTSGNVNKNLVEQNNTDLSSVGSLDSTHLKRETNKANSVWMFSERNKGMKRKKVIKVSIEGNHQVAARFHHFWKSTGLCPPDPHSEASRFLLSQDEKLNLALIGSLPHNGISQVRIHWLLDLVTATLSNGVPLYNFTQLDALLDQLHEYGLKPGFELMGNPSRIFTDFDNDTQVVWWRDLVAKTARRYVVRYGLEWVATWNWESWNEPDHHDFDNLNFTITGFLNYYDACHSGLNSVSDQLFLGGPGGSCRDPSFSRLCWALLEHCQNGSSFFNPGQPPGIDFISFHKKGNEDADSILTQELVTMRKIRKNYPRLKKLPFMNDEGDFLKGWWRGRSWRADSRYAALVVRAISQHHIAHSTIQHFNYKLISFDNAFLNYRPSFFDQRTLLARFQINSSEPHQVQFVKKTAYEVMALLALLGDHTMYHHVDVNDDRLSVMSTCRNCAHEINRISVNNGFTEINNKTVSDRLFTTVSRITDSNTKSKKRKFRKRNFISTKNQKRKNSDFISLLRKNHIDQMHGRQDTDDILFSSDKRKHSSLTSWEATILMSLSNGTTTSSDSDLKLQVTLNIPDSLIEEKLAVMEYELGRSVRGPYEVWTEMGRPSEPSRSQLADIRAAEGLRRVGPQHLLPSTNKLNFSLRLTTPDVHVIHVCQASTVSPGQVVGVKTLGISNADVLITWSDSRINTRCVLAYEVQLSQGSPEGPYFRISGLNTYHNNMIYSLPQINGTNTVTGWYRVRVITYWGTAGSFSLPTYHHA